MATNMQDYKYKRLMDEARKTNRYRTQAEHSSGLESPCDGVLPLASDLACIYSAIEAGLKTGDNKAIAEALAMIEELIEKSGDIFKSAVEMRETGDFDVETMGAAIVLVIGRREAGLFSKKESAVVQ